MTTLLILLILTPAALLLAGWFLPAGRLNRSPRLAGLAVSWLAAWLCVGAAAGLLGRVLGMIPHTLQGAIGPVGPLSWGFLYDGVSSVALLLVSFVGLVVSRYSIRYLDGDPRQGDYFRWVGATLGGVSIAVVSGNLLGLFVAWVATSSSLHQLLTHYADRPGARRAAWTKFAVSRLGDVFLLGALALIYQTYGTLQLTELFAAVGEVGSAAQPVTLLWIGVLLALGGATKSAQAPFHSWLPQTLETPTPVSALMHAGVVNAGGYLVIRMSPVLVQTPFALAILGVLGMITVAVAGLAMMTQPSVKRSLAYSTVAQMGFMMLQCGLGAFSAAMLHLVAHSLYKAYAFLNSGSVLREAQATATDERLAPPRWLAGAAAPVFLAVVVGFAGVAWITGLDLATKPGGLALSAVLCLALTLGLLEAIATRRTASVGVVAWSAIGVAGLYAGAYRLVDVLIADDIAKLSSVTWSNAVGVGAVGVFLGLFVLHVLLRFGPPRRWLEPVYVHALNGFYFDALTRRALRPVTARD